MRSSPKVHRYLISIYRAIDFFESEVNTIFVPRRVQVSVLIRQNIISSLSLPFVFIFRKSAVLLRCCKTLYRENIVVRSLIKSVQSRNLLPLFNLSSYMIKFLFRYCLIKCCGIRIVYHGHQEINAKSFSTTGVIS